MIKIAKIKALGIITLLVFIVSGCSINISPEEIVSVPKLSEENRRIDELIKRNIPENAKFESVKSDEGLSTVKMIDIDGDGVKEIIVTYALDTDKDPLHLLVFRKKNDSYSFMNDISIRGSEFDRIEMKDITGNGKKDLVISSIENNSKILSIYSYQENIEKIFEVGYSGCVMEDINNDGRVDIVIFKKINDALESNYYRYDSKDSKIKFINETTNYIKMGSIHEPMVSNIEKGKKAIIVQGNDQYDQTRYTLVYGLNDEGEFENLMKDTTEEGASIVGLTSLENEYFQVKDIDDDGVVEIPRPYTMIEDTDSSFLNTENYILCTEWFKFKDNKFVEDEKNIYLDGTRVYFKYPGNWENVSITGEVVNTKIGTEFKFLKKDSEGKNNVIATIVKTASNLDRNYKFIKEDKDKKYYIKSERITNDELKDLNINSEDIIKSFKIENKE